MAAHTPGPWVAEIDDHQAPSGDWYAGAVGTGNPYEGTHRTLARVRAAEHAWDGDERARAMADVRLIAAAPEMLAVLELVYVDLVDYSKRLSGAYDTGAIALGSCADQVHAVIRKAKGEVR